MDSVLQEQVTKLASDLEVPGVAAGVLAEGAQSYAFHGMTSVENPRQVDAATLFQFGSTGKTYTASAMMRLVERGEVDLNAPVRRYLPEFRLRDEDVAQRVQVVHLFNHTAGWEGDMMDNTGDGDDALERYVALMPKLEQVSAPGETVSYNNASLSVAGRIIEKLCGTTYERAIRDLLLTPLGLSATYFFPGEIMTRRFAVGHTRHEDGRITVSRPWAMPRGNAAAGGMSATAADQLAWARFHLGDGTAPDGTRLLQPETLRLMREPTASMPGSALGDHVGISWLLRDVGGVRLAGHGGTTIGQYSGFTMVPERGFAIISMTNCGPNGAEFNSQLERWALWHYLAIDDTDPEPVPLADEALAQYVGSYETIVAVCDVTAKAGRLMVTVTVKPEMAAILRESGEEIPDDQPPIPLGLLASEGDRYIVPEGPAKGSKGYFTRDAGGHVTGVHLGGRLATRIAAVPA